MPAVSSHAVDVYATRDAAAGPEWLVLRRAGGRRFAGQWRAIGGKIEDGEAAHAAARRELAEETGFAPGAGLVALWALPSVNAFYEVETDRVVLAPAFVAHVTGEAVLCGEHDTHAWLPAAEAAARLAWPEPARLVALAERLVRAGTILDDWRVPL